MAGFLFRLIMLVGLFALGSYVVLDEPEKTYRELYEDLRCQLDRTRCVVIAELLAPRVNVLFVDPDFRSREGRQVAILGDAWPYCDDATGDVYMIPQFFETDFASIPGFARGYINPQGERIVGPAIVHDWLYALGGAPRDAAREKADRIFRAELKNENVNVIKRNIMYRAVKHFGGATFGTDAEMRFRNPYTGASYTAARPEPPVIGNIGPGCDPEVFHETYWAPLRETNYKVYDLAVGFISQEWLDINDADF